jgi:hypothetical protein
MAKNNNTLFVNKDWTEEQKAIYFKNYMKLKLMLRKWHKTPKKFKEINMYQYGKDNMGTGIWKDIIDEQMYEPMIKTKFTATIW